MKQIPNSWHDNVENFEEGEIVKVKSAEELAKYVHDGDTIFEFADLVGKVQQINTFGMLVSGVQHSRLFGCFERVAEEAPDAEEIPDIDIYSLIAD